MGELPRPSRHHGHPEYYRAFIGMGQLAGSREQASALRQAFLSRTINERGDPKRLTRNATVEVNEDDLFRSGGELHAS